MVNILIKVFTAEKKTLLFTSDMDSVRYNASPHEEINITIQDDIGPEMVEYDLILREVTSLAGKVAITDLQENKEHKDITYLSRELDLPAEKLEHLVVAHRLKKISGIDAAFFYALLRKNTLIKNDFKKTLDTRLTIGMSTNIQLLLYDAALANPESIIRDLKSAAEEMIVDPKTVKESKRNIELLLKYKKEAEEYFERAYNLYNLFWALNLKIILILASARL